MGNKSVHKLTPECSTPFLIIGIASHENDYRISWALNSTLGFHFTKTDNHKVFHKRFNEMQEFSMYRSNDDDASPVYKLIANCCDNGFLLEELRTIDFVLVVENAASLGDGSQTIHQLKGIPFISTAFIVNPSTLKGLNRIK
jgi:hypothetical protein